MLPRSSESLELDDWPPWWSGLGTGQPSPLGLRDHSYAPVWIRTPPCRVKEPVIRLEPMRYAGHIRHAERASPAPPRGGGGGEPNVALLSPGIVVEGCFDPPTSSGSGARLTAPARNPFASRRRDPTRSHTGSSPASRRRSPTGSPHGVGKPPVLFCASRRDGVTGFPKTGTHRPVLSPLVSPSTRLIWRSLLESFAGREEVPPTVEEQVCFRNGGLALPSRAGDRSGGKCRVAPLGLLF